MAFLLSTSKAPAAFSAPHVAANRSLLKPQVFVQRSRTAAAGSAYATAKAPASAVKITIQGRRLPVTPAIRDYVEDKITKAVHNFAHTIKNIQVTISARGGDTGTLGAKEQKVDVTIQTLRNGIVRVEDAENSLYASIDIVCDKVSRKLRKLKEKAIVKGTWPGRAGPRVDVEDEEEKEYWENLIVETANYETPEALKSVEQVEPEEGQDAMPDSVLRSKVLKLEPMSVDDAIDAMEAVGHDFYLFKDKGSNSMQVVYKRESGGYGILIPQ